MNKGGAPTVVREPTVLFYPRPEQHTFQTEGADIVCAFVEFGAGMLNPLARALPKLLLVPVASIPELHPTVTLLFAEAFAQRVGRQAAVDRLTEYFIVLLLRSAIGSTIVNGGILTALADTRLAKALTAMHEQPERNWSLEELGQIAGMSRARFATHFHATMGQTPFEYLTLWRIGLAQSLLRKGEPLKIIAPFVGYGSAAALNRSFSHHVGVSPKAWLASQQPGEIRLGQ